MTKKITSKMMANAAGDYKKLTKMAEKNSEKYGWKSTQKKLSTAFKKI